MQNTRLLRSFCAGFGAVLLAVFPSGAESIALNPIADATLIEVAPLANNGAERWVNGGTTQNFTRNRGLFRFDLASQIPSGSIINSVSLVLEVTRQPADGFAVGEFSLHRMLRSWGEGSKFAIDNNGGFGAPATPNNTEVTWTDRFYPDFPWAAPGGAAGVDYSIDQSSAQVIYGVGLSPYAFATTSELVDDVQTWVDNPVVNFGWLLRAQVEEPNFTARRFGSRESGAPPILFVDFTVVPEPGVAAIGALGLVGWLLARRRHCR